MPVGAIIGAAAIGAGATVYASSQASQAISSSSNTAAQVQQNALNQELQLAQPYTAAGQTAIAPLQQLLGINPNQGQPGAAGAGGTMAGGGQPQNNTGALAALQNTPGYQFSLAQGEGATMNASTLMGGGVSGNTLEALTKYASGLAQGTWQNQVSNLQNLVNTGQGAAAGAAANVAGTANNLSNIATTAGTNQANLTLGEAGNLTSTFNNAANQYAGMQNFQNLLGSVQGGPPGPNWNPNAMYSSPGAGLASIGQMPGIGGWQPPPTGQ